MPIKKIKIKIFKIPFLTVTILGLHLYIFVPNKTKGISIILHGFIVLHKVIYKLLVYKSKRPN